MDSQYDTKVDLWWGCVFYYLFVVMVFSSPSLSFTKLTSVSPSCTQPYFSSSTVGWHISTQPISSHALLVVSFLVTCLFFHHLSFFIAQISAFTLFLVFVNSLMSDIVDICHFICWTCWYQCFCWHVMRFYVIW